jgi:hypothetical protein
MPIDIDLLTESESIDLNHRVVARLQFLRQLAAHRHCSSSESVSGLSASD